jgi:phage baseplate assembly protein W
MKFRRFIAIIHTPVQKRENAPAYGCRQITSVQPLNETAQFSIRELLGGAYRLLNPAVNGELLFLREFEDFKPLVFRGLFVG